MTALSLRPADREDMRDIWNWRNDPETRRHSKTSDAVSWADHERWFNASAGRRGRVMFVGLSGGDKTGTVRFDRQLDRDGAWLVSITMNPEFRGRGLGKSLLAQACAALGRQHGVSALDAEIHAANPASLRLFSAAGFVHIGNSAQEGFQLFRRSAISESHETPNLGSHAGHDGNRNRGPQDRRGPSALYHLRIVRQPQRIA